MERIIFAIDNDNDPHVNAKFLRLADTLAAMDKIQPVVLCIGSWQGVLERSYMVLAKDFHHFEDYVRYQQAVLHVPSDVRQPCCLSFPSGTRISVGQMVEVEGDEALRSRGWTYVDGKYFVCRTED